MSCNIFFDFAESFLVSMCVKIMHMRDWTTDWWDIKQY